jgi:hypothetical protein
MNPMLTVLYLDAQRAESVPLARSRRPGPSNARIRHGRSSRRWF